MIRLRSKNLVDYDKMRTIESGADISYIDRGWLVGRGSNYGRTIVDLSSLAIKQGETYYIVADVELVSMGATGVFVSIVLLTNGIVGSIISGKQINNMQLGESQRVVIRCIPDKAVGSTKSILAYNGNGTTESVGWSFKITNLCLFKEDYTIDYEPYWYEPQKIMTRTRNLFDDINIWNKSHIDVPNGFQLSGWSNKIMNEAQCKALFTEGETYTFSYDWEFANDNYLLGSNDKTVGFLMYYNNSSSIGLRIDNVSSNAKGHFEKTFIAPAWGNNVEFVCLISNSTGDDGTVYSNIVNFTNVILTKGDKIIAYQPYMSEVKTIAWGVKDECKLVLDGSENWKQYRDDSANVMGVIMYVNSNAQSIRPSSYNNYFGFHYYSDMGCVAWLAPNNQRLGWHIGSPPFPAWETTDSDGNAIANIPQIKADLAKRNLVVYYDNANVKPKTLAELLKIVRREVYNQFIAVVDGDTLQISGKMSDGVLELDSNKVSVSDSTLQINEGGG